jgi:hypothetical protein
MEQWKTLYISYLSGTGNALVSSHCFGDGIKEKNHKE